MKPHYESPDDQTHTDDPPEAVAAAEALKVQYEETTPRESRTLRYAPEIGKRTAIVTYDPLDTDERKLAIKALDDLQDRDWNIISTTTPAHNHGFITVMLTRYIFATPDPEPVALVEVPVEVKPEPEVRTVTGTLIMDVYELDAHIYGGSLSNPTFIEALRSKQYSLDELKAVGNNAPTVQHGKEIILDAIEKLMRPPSFPFRPFGLPAEVQQS